MSPYFREGDVLTVVATYAENGLQVGWTVVVAEDQTEDGQVRVWFGGKQYVHGTSVLEIWSPE
jgi:hypothetical protein